jgi:hypothetical protein
MIVDGKCAAEDVGDGAMAGGALGDGTGGNAEESRLSRMPQDTRVPLSECTIKARSTKDSSKPVSTQPTKLASPSSSVE